MLDTGEIERLGLAVDQPVTVTSEIGSIPTVLVRAADIRPGNAVMYYPEANVIIPSRTDPRAGTPTFKNTVITIQAKSEGSRIPGAC